MTDTTTDATTSSAPVAKKSSGGLGGKVLAELQEIAADLGVDGAASMRKGALIDAIKTARGDAPATPRAAKSAPAEETTEAPQATKVDQAEKPGRAARAPKGDQEPQTDGPAKGGRGQGRNRGGQDKGSQDKGSQGKNDQAKDEQGKNDQGKNDQGKNEQGRNDDTGKDGKDGNGGEGRQGRGQGRGQDQNRQQDGGRQQGKGQNQGGGQNQPNQGGQNQPNQGGQNRQQDGGQGFDDDEDGNGRRRNRRGRNRNSRGMEADPTYSEDDVLVPAAGILDILDNYAFVRTTGYLPSENDVYVSLSMVRKWNLRRGDAVTGQVRQPREGERKEKFNPMVKVETVNGMSLEESAKRVEFSRLTPLHPSERLRLESEAGGPAGRVIDLVAPLGKGQRGLIVSPPKAGKSAIMQQVANAITENNPECHLMIVLVDERPEEVTDFQRSVKGEVITSTFDRPAGDHTMVAELAIERAKRLVELGHDVVVLLDGVTRLGRAYNQTAPAGGRVVSGDVDTSALYPPKKFFGAARNIEDGGSLTILATALVETGSRTDEVILDEFTDAGNWELRLRRDLADKRLFPAVDVAASGTSRDELLLAPEEIAAVTKLRRRLADLDPQQGLQLVVDGLTTSADNAAFLKTV